MDLSSHNALLKKLTRHTLTPEEIRWVVGRINPVFHVAGKLGPWVLRWHNGKPIISKNAVYNISQTEASIKNRNSMSAAINFAIALNKIPALKKIWTASKAEGKTSYTKLIKHCKKKLVNNLPSVYNSLTPDENQFVINEQVTFDSDKRISINYKSSPDETLVIVLVPFEPVNKGYKPFEVINVYDSAPVQNNVITLTDEQTAICSRYKKYILYTAVVNENLTWSNTTAIEGEFCIEELNSPDFENVKAILLLYLFLHINKIYAKDHAPPGSQQSPIGSRQLAVCNGQSAII